MKVKNHKEFTLFDYISTEEETDYQLGDVVTKVSADGTEIGVVIQVHDENELRADMFGNCSTSEIVPSTVKEIKEHRGKLIEHL